MGKKTSTPRLTSNTSSAANPKASSSTLSSSNSSILRSSFAPSRFHLSLFASVIQALDSQHVRIHNTLGQLRCDHSLGSRATINCLAWGYYGHRRSERSDVEINKKRKRQDQVNGTRDGRQSEDVVLALGTTDSDIQFYSPSEAKIVGLLKDGHSGGVKDFQFVRDGEGHSAWSIGGDGRAIQWNLKKNKISRTITLPNGPANVICPCASSVLCASNIVNVIDSDSELSSTTYTASTTSVHTLIVDPAETDSSQKFLTAAEYNPVINVFREGTSTMIGMLRSENEVLRADLWSRSQRILPNKEGRELSQRLLHPQELLVALNKDGVLELFPSPFDFDTVPSTGMSVSREAKKGRSRKSVAQVQVIRPDKGSASVPLINASFQDDNLVLAWAEGGVGVAFHMVPWRDEETGKLLLHGRTQIEKARSASGIGGTITNGVKDMSRVQVNDSHAVVANGAESDDASSEDEQPEMIEISSGEEESEFEEDGEPPRRLHTEEHDTPQSKNELDGATSEDIIMEDTQAIGKANEQISEDELEAAGESNEDAEPPTFGDLIRANAPSAIDVPNTPREDATQSLGRIGTTSIQAIPQGMSLGTVLTQALRTNDISLLESCIHTRDLSSVRATIERLESTFASTLLQRLAERLHSRPGRAGTLMVWIQWTLVAHGGYLASQPEVMSKLRSLHQVVRDRASSLPNLLSLKGKLDMLEAQMNLRKRSAQRWDRRAHEDEDDDAEEEAVIYVEGQEDREVNKIAEDEDDDLEDLEDDEDGDDSAEGDEEEEDEEGDPEGDEEDEEDDDDDLEEEERGIEVETIPNPKPKSATKPPKIHPASIPNGTSSPPLSPIEATSDDSSSASDDEVDEANEVLIDDEASSTGSSRSGSPQSSSEDNSSSEDDEDIDHESVDSEGSSIGEDEEEEGAAASSSSSAASPPAKKVKVRKSR